MNQKISNARITESKYTNEPINLFQIIKKLNYKSSNYRGEGVEQ